MSSPFTPMSSSSTDHQTHPRFGSSTELFNLNCFSELVVLDYDGNREVNLLRYGVFIVNLLMQALSPLMMIACAVDGLQWPISKDAPILRVGQRSFAFGMPGLLYGLKLPLNCEEGKISRLEAVFMSFGHYCGLDKKKRIGYQLKDDDPKFWEKILPIVKTLAHSTLSKFGHHPGKSPSAVDSLDSYTLRVVRTSAITKLVGNAILSGFLKSDHIEIQDMRLMRMRKRGGDGGSSDIISEQAHASISVFTNLVETVEVLWVLYCGKSNLLKEKTKNMKELVGSKMWKLNQQWIAAFMKKLEVVE